MGAPRALGAPVHDARAGTQQKIAFWIRADTNAYQMMLQSVPDCDH